MGVCMVPETLTGCQRSPLQAELEDVRELKRQRDLDGQPRRMTLRSEAERHSPTRLDDYHVYASYCARDQTTDPIATNKKWHIKDVQVPQSYSQAVRSPQREEWLEDIYQEVEAMFSKGVFVMIDEKKMPSEANLLSTMWRYRPKTDLEGFVNKWRARLVGRGDSQEFGIDYVISFSPVARMSHSVW
ncbi:hypothetical protein PC116_g27452 [Phytophthora cactorum]|nr:hypothetical protein Pcac1_g1203 [Phytophthora cactorum]KAG4224090.1 hypothetical protein PC116_g27452 [Phytophthora cactorum]